MGGIILGLMVGSVIFGVATPIETAGMAVVYGLIIGFFIAGLSSIKELPKAMRYAIVTSAKIMMIIAFSQLYIWLLALERIPDQLTGFVVSLNLGPSELMLVIAGLILIAGTFIDVSPAILLLTPVLYARGDICWNFWSPLWCGYGFEIGRGRMYATGRKLPQCMRGNRENRNRRNISWRSAILTSKPASFDSDLPFPTTRSLDSAAILLVMSLGLRESCLIRPARYCYL